MSSVAGRVGQIEVGGDVVSYVTERSRARRKTIAIRLLPDGSLLVRAPMRTATAEIELALTLRTSWISRARSTVTPLPAAEPLSRRATLPYLGEDVTAIGGLPAVPDFKLAAAVQQRPVSATLEMNEEAVGVKLIAWYRAAAAHLLPPQVTHRATLIGRTPTRVVISRQKHAWGSCGRDGVIRLSYRLMMLRPELIDCVIVHELCHLVHLNHSPAFWAEVARWQPGYKELRAELKASARGLPV
ncbi:MAG: SprT family zinc-dependent metalloprotease [Anaerolineaceae bacterium]